MGLSFFLNNLIGFIFIGLAVTFSASDPSLFFNIPSLLIVVGGSLAALLASYPLKDIKSAMTLTRSLFNEPPLDEAREVEAIVQFAVLWQRHDFRGMEYRLAQTENRFLHTGIQLLLSKIPVQDVIGTLGWRIRRLKVREQAEARVFHSLASYAPAFGMVGTLIGLVNMMLVMKNTSASDLGANWAIALVTTFYGVLLANLVFKPIATKLERRTERRLLLMTMVLEGINLMGMGRSPAFIRESLSSFVAHYDNELAHPGVEKSAPGLAIKIAPH
ncbi:MAG: MotA/TolQ/ExbB proton channel family protein [Hahellaceae bacterium]|nr:MotA/TolQ/ExbB proton channel family protein [Hahellaceae bacterium]